MESPCAWFVTNATQPRQQYGGNQQSTGGSMTPCDTVPFAFVLTGLLGSQTQQLHSTVQSSSSSSSSQPKPKPPPQPGNSQLGLFVHDPGYSFATDTTLTIAASRATAIVVSSVASTGRVAGSRASRRSPPRAQPLRSMSLADMRSRAWGSGSPSPWESAS